MGSTVEILIEEVGDASAEGRAAHQAPEVDGSCTVQLAEGGMARLAVGDLVRATVVGTEGVDLVTELVEVLVPHRAPGGDRRRADGGLAGEPPRFTAGAPRLRRRRSRAARVPKPRRASQQRLQAVPSRPDPAGDAPSGVGNWNLANVLTGFRILLVPVFAVFLFAGTGHQTGWRIAAWGAYATAAFTDRFDGQIARARGPGHRVRQAARPHRRQGAGRHGPHRPVDLDDLSWWVTAVVLAREIGVTLLRFWVLRHGVIPASRGGKLKTLLLNVGIGLYVLPLSGALHVVAAVILGAAVVVALVTAVDYVGTALRMRRAANAG